MKIEINFKADYERTKPVCRIYSHNSSHQIVLEHESTFAGDFDLEERDTLHIEFINKDDIDDNVIHIDRVLVDDINLQHFIYEGEFFPQYEPNWLKKQKESPPDSYKPCTELRLKGIWELQINTPIWKMIMEKWLNDER